MEEEFVKWFLYSDKILFFFFFREVRDKGDIEFGDNGTTVTAVSNKAYVFERNQSVGDPKIDLIRTLNIPAVVSSYFKYHYCRF